MLTAITRYGIILILLTALGACGGGGGGSGDTSVTPPPPPPPPTTFSIGGTASGVAGSGLTLQNNGADTLAVTADGSFTFATRVNSGDTYDVGVATQPGNPAQNCTVANGSGTATTNVTNITVSCATVSAADTDMDGISDADEQSIYGTNWEDPDTDGDGYTDGNEVQTYDPSVNNFRFNPLVADVPEIRIEIQETPQIGANITEANSSQQTVSTTRAQSTSNTSSTTFGASTTLGVEASQSSTVGASLQGPSAEVETQVKVTAEATVSFDSTTSSENRSAWEEMQANNIETATTVSDGFVSVGVNIVNSGHLSLRIDALDLVAVRVNDGDEPFSAVGTLARDVAFSPIDLEAGESIDNLRFERTQIDLPTLRSLLTDTRSLKLEQGNVTIVDTSDSSVALQAQDINRRTAKLVIDYGPYAPTEFYRASTNVIPNQPGRSLATLMRDTLRIPFDEDGTGLTAVRSQSSSTGRWVVTLKRSGDTATQVIPYDAQDASYSLDDIDVRAFDEVLLVLLEDPDNDGIGYREELLHGTDPLSADTDGDGRSDFEEIRESWFVNAINAQDPNRYNDTEVTSSPTIADYDNDGLSDSEEFRDLLDPYNADTDGDGIGDASDPINGGAPLFSVLPLLLGEDPAANAAAASPFAVQTSGTISAEAPRVVATASISWGDGAIDGPFETNPGGQSQRTIPLTTHTYPGPGDYQISLDANDDDTPVNTLNETAMVSLTAPEEPIDGAGYDAGYRLSIHLRTAADMNQDGYDDVIVMSNSITRISFGSPDGLQPYETWYDGHWVPTVYEGLETDPRLLADIDDDGDLDLVGVDSSEGVVNYALNNGTGFDDPVVWLTGLDWNTERDQAFLADVDGNGFIDFVHASTADQSVTSYVSNGSSLTLNAVPGEIFDSRYPDRTRFPMHVKDMNSDGCADIVLFGQDDTFVSQSLCNGSFDQYVSVVGGFGFDQGYRVGREERWVEDMTGDGMPDLVAAAGAVVVMYVNTSTTQSISVDVGNRQTLGTDFVTDDGWAYNRDIDSRNSFGVFPRYLADINADGLMDIVGFGAPGATVSINQRGADGAREFSDQRIVARVFDVTANTDWYRDFTCGLSQPCREYGPRFVGDVNGDGRADLIGFTAGPSVYQEMPYVTQFE